VIPGVPPAVHQESRSGPNVKHQVGLGCQTSAGTGQGRPPPVCSYLLFLIKGAFGAGRAELRPPAGLRPPHEARDHIQGSS
jgi:hypothetical protein